MQSLLFSSEATAGGARSSAGANFCGSARAQLFANLRSTLGDLMPCMNTAC